MTCETLRARLAENPAADNAEFEAHAERCAPCRAFRRRLGKAEALIERALRIDVAALASGVPRRAAPLASRWVSALGALAASLLAALSFWSFSGGGLAITPDELAAAVVEHWAHEPESLEPASPLSLDDLAAVLVGTAAMDQAAAARVSYARICRVGGHVVPHLVLHGDTGPYMVLLMPGEALASEVPLAAAESGLAGRIIPSSGGNIAVLGRASPELGAIESLLSSAVDWTGGP